MKARNFKEKPLERFDVVLVRRPELKPDDRTWIVSTFDRAKEAGGKTTYLCGGVWYLECIQYRYNEELLSTDGIPKDIGAIEWGDRVMVADSPQGPWDEALFMDFTEGSAEPWKVIVKSNAAIALATNSNPIFFSKRYLRLAE